MLKRFLYTVSSLLFLFSISSCSYINPYLGLQDDNFLEEFGERVLEDETGIDIDFSHETPEAEKWK